MNRERDEFFMREALAQACRAWGDTFPNPMVGSVIVKDGKVIATGYHAKDGGFHAERDALSKLDYKAFGATMYVTLEPCSSAGRTGACTDIIAKSGISRVVIGALDPNPENACKAEKFLRNFGIEVEIGVLQKECEDINFIFNFNMRKKTCMLAMKFAQSSDGKIAEKQGVHTRITGEESRADVMKYRRLFQAIGIGFGTLETDNPSLTSRIGDEVKCGVRLVFDRNLNTASLDISKFDLFSDEFAKNTRVVCDLDSPKEKVEALRKKGINVMIVDSHRSEEKKFWTELKRKLYSEKICGLYVEGGSGILSSLVKTNSYDYAFIYQSPKTFGDNGVPALEENLSIDFSKLEQKQFGQDTCFFGSR